MSEIRVDTISEKTSANGVAIDSVTLKDGGATLTDNITFSASGKGVHLGVTSATSSNLLDDYEAGSATISITDASGNAISLGNTTLSYTKVGRIVHTHGYFNCTGLGSASGSLKINGLPFAIPNENSAYASASVGWAFGLSVTAGHNLGGYGAINTSVIQLTIYNSTGGIDNFKTPSLTADGQFMISFSYRTAA